MPTADKPRDLKRPDPETLAQRAFELPPDNQRGSRPFKGDQGEGVDAPYSSRGS